MSSNKVPENIISNKLFAGVNSEILSILNDPKNIVELKEGTLIYSTGDMSNFIYLLLRGEVKLKHSIQKKLIFKFKDDYFGEQEIVEKTNRLTSAVANSDCLLLKISADVLWKLASTSPQLKNNLFGIEGTPVENNNVEDENIKNHQSVELIDQKTITDESSDTYSDKIQNEENNYQNTDENILNEDNSLSRDLLNQDDSDKEEIFNSEESNTEEIIGTNKDNSIEVIEVTNLPQEDSVDNFSFNKGWEKFQSILQPSDDLKQVAKGIVALLLKQTESEIGAFYLFNADDNRLEDYYQTHDSIYKTKRPLKDGLSNLAVKQKKIIYAAHFSNHSSYNEEIDLPNEFEGNTIIFIPLFDSKDKLLAIVQIGSDQTEFSKDEERKLEDSVSYCSMILEKSISIINSKKEEEIPVQTPEDANLIAGLLLEDIKNPLQNIRHYASILSRFNLADEVKKVIALITAQSSSTIDVLQSIIDYSNQNYKSEMELNNFNEIVNQTLILLSDFVESKKVKLFKKLAADTLINIDARKFYVACYFITKFSCNMMPDGGKLYFSAGSEDSEANLVIKDESGGLRNDEIHKALESHYFIDKNNCTINGLAVPKFLIKAMNGSFNIENTGSGILYRITLPRAFS